MSKTINYKEKYEKALERARVYWENDNDNTLDIKAKGTMEYLFPELTESEDDRIIKEIIQSIKGNMIVIHKNKCLAWLEKVRRDNKFLKSIKVGDTITKSPDGILVNLGQSDKALEHHDKVEPKFKVGDWVMLDRPVLITKVENMPYNTHQYWTSDGTWFGDATKAKLWTIKDAKDGDVLFHSDSASNGIFIFKEIIDKGFANKVICYCDYDSEDHFCLGEHHTCCWADAKILHPATKEQRDTLMKAMADAGYEWDAEKKEVKLLITNGGDFDTENCEQNTDWSEDDEEFLSEIISDIKFAQDKHPDSQMNQIIFEEEVTWLKSLKERIK